MKISQDTLEIIALFYKNLEKRGTIRGTKEAPENMVKSEPDKYGVLRWKPINNTLVTQKDFETWEEKIGVKYPAIYKTWFLSHHMFTLKFENIDLVGNHPKNGLSELESLVKSGFGR